MLEAPADITPAKIRNSAMDLLTGREYSRAELADKLNKRFDHHSADYLKELLGAVVRYAQGGRRALTSSGRESDKLLLMQLPRKPTN